MDSITFADSERLGSTFHRTFALNMPALKQVMEIAADYEKSSDKTFDETLREKTSLGTIYTESMPRYGYGTGLLRKQSKLPTALGRVVYEHDPNLTLPATLWLMHYHLSAPTGPGPAFWHYLTSQKLIPGTRYEADVIPELIEDTRTFLLEREGTDLADRSARSLITIYKGTYLKADALGSLKILEPLDDNDKSFQVCTPDTPPAAAVGYALAHFWQNALPDPESKFVNLSDLEAFARLLFLNSYKFNRILRTLQRWGLLEVHQVAPPHQVMRGWESADVFLERLYE